VEISGKVKERSTVITAVLALAIVGISLIFSTWQTFKHLGEAEEQHLHLTSRAILLALENSLRHGGPMYMRKNSVTPRTRELFAALRSDGDLIFADILDHQGILLASSADNSEGEVVLPIDLEKLFSAGEWHGRHMVGDTPAYINVKMLEAPMASFRMAHENPVPPTFLVVALDTEKYLDLHQGFRKNIRLQSLYILVAALVCSVLAFRFLARREQARRADRLERFQARLLDNLPDGLLTTDRHGLILSANPAALAILGKTAIVDLKVSELPPAIAEAVEPKPGAPITFAVPGCAGALSGWQSVNLETQHLEVRALPVADDEIIDSIIILRDRTQLRTLEDDLAKAEKLAAIGSLAAGVAHEVRNPLSALRGFAQYFMRKLAGQQPEETYARTMMEEADRLNRVITDLLFLAKPKRLDPRAVSLPALAGDLETLLRFDLEQKKILLLTEWETDTLFADPDALKQCVLNLLLNSLDALQAGNREQRVLRLSSLTDDGGVWIEVADNGCGMDEEQAARAFEPFYTAKSTGTGLGLAIVQSCMTEHGGSVDIHSVPGEGCAIRLFFPDAANGGFPL
jgi:Signal transduction histidine kinase involved in nitrogen fixation and metabolism regulation